MDSYELLLPSTVIMAKITFTGGNNAQNFEVFTAKDSHKRAVSIATGDKIIAASSGIDKKLHQLKEHSEMTGRKPAPLIRLFPCS